MSKTGRDIIQGLQDAIHGRATVAQYRRCTKCWYGPKTFHGECAECHGKGLVPIVALANPDESA